MRRRLPSSGKTFPTVAPQIIREGYPCHLYFDLEFQRPCNPTVDGDALLGLLVHLADDCLQCRFGFGLSLDSIVELDSTTDAKWSRHLVLPLAGRAWASNLHAGAFVGEVLQTAKQRRL